MNPFPRKCNCVWWCRKEEEEESFMLSTKITLPFFLGMHILFFTLPNFLLQFLWWYIIYHYIYSSIISHIFSLQICSFLCRALFSLFSLSSLGVFSCQCYVSTHLNIMPWKISSRWLCLFTAWKISSSECLASLYKWSGKTTRQKGENCQVKEWWWILWKVWKKWTAPWFIW